MRNPELERKEVMSNSIETLRIYVACLAAYNNGKLHGAWIDALDNDAAAIMAEVQSMLKRSPEPDAEEWAIHDYEGFEGIRLSEWESFDQVHRLAQFVEEHSKLGAELINHFGGDLEYAQSVMEEGYQGCYESLANFAEELTTDTTQIPENLRYYIDYARIARDMEMSGDIFTIETAHDEVHVFWSR
jgi:antirestriction protein